MQSAQHGKRAALTTENGAPNSKYQKKSLDDASYKDLIPYTSDGSTTEEFIDKFVAEVKQYILSFVDRDSKVIEFASPEELQKCIDFNLNDAGEKLSDVVGLAQKVLKYSLKSGHSRYMNTLWAGIDISCLMGEWVKTVTNTTMYTYEVAPVYTMMEKYMLEKLCSFVGFKNGDGIFFPGGSLCNIQAMSLARFKAIPNVVSDGLFGHKRLIVYVSEEGHYSITKGASLLGLGTNSVVEVEADSRGKMVVSDLEEKIKESMKLGHQPFIVCAMAGTTVGGAYDPFNEIADVCEKYDLWLHVDGAWGGSCVVSKTHKHLMDGIHRAHSLTWDPHKMMNCLLQCSVLLVRENGLLHSCNKNNASYLFMKDKKLYDVEWDTGDKTFQCGRIVDVLKLWLMWKAKGTSGIEEQIDRAFDNARYFADKLKERSNFELLREPECTNVCFRYVPPRIAAMHAGPERDEQLAKVPPEIKRRMTIKGSMMITYQPLRHHFNFFRLVFVNPGVSHADLDFILDEIERLGKDL